MPMSHQLTSSLQKNSVEFGSWTETPWSKWKHSPGPKYALVSKCIISRDTYKSDPHHRNVKEKYFSLGDKELERSFYKHICMPLILYIWIILFLTLNISVNIWRNKIIFILSTCSFVSINIWSLYQGK